MAIIPMKSLLEAGVHFGHQTKRWDPRMAPYIFTARNGIYILDLQKTLKKLQEAYNETKKVVAEGGVVLFVGTKKQIQETIKSEAERCGMYYINSRWLGGTLTNFATIKTRIARLNELEKMEADGTFEVLPKKEVIGIRKEYEKLNKNLRGIREMNKIHQALVIVDPRKEENAIKEAHILGIPVFGIVDTNCDPDLVDYVIPGNDDAIRAVKVVLGVLTNAISEVNGKEILDFITEEEKPKKANNNSNTSKKEVKSENKEEKEITTENFEELTLNDLKNMAKEKGIKGYSTMKKQELIEALS